MPAYSGIVCWYYHHCHHLHHHHHRNKDNDDDHHYITITTIKDVGNCICLDYAFVPVAGWHQPTSLNGRPSGHNRSLSSILRSASPKPPVSRARSSSTAELSTTAADAARPRHLGTPQQRRLLVPTSLDDDNDLSTLPDPRSRGQTPASHEATSSPDHPGPDDEVTALSTKLIRAINHQTTLDDHLAEARLELEKAEERIRELEALVEEQKKTAEQEKAALEARIAEEQTARVDMEQQKKKIEQELENLTAALFEEANKMVISAKEDARLEQEALQRKNDQLRAQLADTEGLLLSQQEQLVELKHVMEQIALEKTEPSPPAVPSSPDVDTFDARETQALPAGAASARASLSVPMSPSYPTSFTHLLHPVLRTDLAAYQDFRELLRTSKRLSGQRLSTGSTFASLAIGLGSVTANPLAGSAGSSTSSVGTAATPPSASPQAPNTPASSVGTPASAAAAPLPPLRETKFYKRVLIEDIEPTLRLDTAPGLSWLARRSVIASMTDGSLVVEPTPSTATGRFGRVVKPELNPCALCGESRKEEEHLRTHRFRVSEADATQVGYPLCRYCLGRVRSTCEFLGFLRIVKDGHWRADDDDSEKAAWEESVRLREQMFWARIGGGVVPASHARHFSTSSVAPSFRVRDKSPGPSREEPPAGERGSAKPLPELPAASSEETVNAGRSSTEFAQPTPSTDDKATDENLPETPLNDAEDQPIKPVALSQPAEEALSPTAVTPAQSPPDSDLVSQPQQQQQPDETKPLPEADAGADGLKQAPVALAAANA
ncbi:hypothetical protein VTJ83DRAFT_1562 [Remersonia thermophila]|uniref:GDP/GTP exchange factor Sec2 N-terminal domain-containing protein n=1 Tax=Remersonia thermophila TaxID=72144 RepID=A0ABR4DG89_9PEZI